MTMTLSTTAQMAPTLTNTEWLQTLASETEEVALEAYAQLTEMVNENGYPLDDIRDFIETHGAKAYTAGHYATWCQITEELRVSDEVIEAFVEEFGINCIDGFEDSYCGTYRDGAEYARELVEGGWSKDFRRIKTLAFDQPEAMHLLLDKLAQAVTGYLNGQIRAGAQAIQIFDTWGGVLSTPAYQEFSLDYMTRILRGLERESEGRTVPVILFTKQGGQWLELIAASGCDCLGLDWTTEIGHARQRVGGTVALQGNMDPAMLYASPARIRQEVGRILASYGSGNGHVFNLGHGITPEVDPEHARAFIEAVHELSLAYH